MLLMQPTELKYRHIAPELRATLLKRDDLAETIIKHLQTPFARIAPMRKLIKEIDIKVLMQLAGYQDEHGNSVFAILRACYQIDHDEEAGNLLDLIHHRLVYGDGKLFYAQQRTVYDGMGRPLPKKLGTVQANIMCFRQSEVVPAFFALVQQDTLNEADFKKLMRQQVYNPNYWFALLTQTNQAGYTVIDVLRQRAHTDPSAQNILKKLHRALEIVIEVRSSKYIRYGAPEVTLYFDDNISFYRKLSKNHLRIMMGMPLELPAPEDVGAIKKALAPLQSEELSSPSTGGLYSHQTSCFALALAYNNPSAVQALLSYTSSAADFAEALKMGMQRYQRTQDAEHLQLITSVMNLKLSEIISNPEQAKEFFKARSRFLQETGYSPLGYAVKLQMDAIVNTIIDAYTQQTQCIEAVEQDLLRAVEQATQQGDDQLVDKLLGSFKDRNTQQQAQDKALLLSAQYGHTTTVLAEPPGVVKVTDRQSNTALHLAAANGHTEVCKQLLARGADGRALNKAGKTAAQLTQNPEIQALFELDEYILQLVERESEYLTGNFAAFFAPASRRVPRELKLSAAQTVRRIVLGDNTLSLDKHQRALGSGDLKKIVQRLAQVNPNLADKLNVPVVKAVEVPVADKSENLGDATKVGIDLLPEVHLTSPMMF